MSAVASRPRLLKAKEVAADLRVTTKTVAKMCNRGELPGAVKVVGEWRIPVEAVIAAIRGEQ